MMEAGKPQWVISFIRGFEPSQRLQLYHFARELFLFAPWEDKDLDDLVTISDAGIEEAMRQAKEAPRETEIIEALVDQANVMSYNLSADLADCWPGDTLVRYRRHYERGLSAALQCVEWRTELDKGSYPLFLAYWAAGMHQLSLGRYQQALYTLNQALNHAQQHTIDSGLPLGLCPEAGFDLILAHGYLGVALVMCGEGCEQYDLAIQAFEEGIEELPERAEDYRFGIAQLRRVRARIIGE
jgi:tetratricopeptide (TPR) repeat protein